jgi:hypothetical protein
MEDSMMVEVPPECGDLLIQAAALLGIQWKYRASTEFDNGLEVLDDSSNVVALIYAEQKPVPTMAGIVRYGVYYSASYEVCTDQGNREQPPVYEYVEVCVPSRSFYNVALALICKEVESRISGIFDAY